MRASAEGRRPRLRFLAVAAAVLALDQLTKAAAAARLETGTPVPLAGGLLRLTLTHNPESAFGLVSARWFLIAVGGLVCSGILAYVFLSEGGTRTGRRAWPLGLVFGGSLGNLMDRVRTGGVYDLIDLTVWPVFNLADVAITVGVAALLLSMVRRH